MRWLGFSGRCNQQQYWIMVAVLFAAPMLASIVRLPVEGAEAFWLILYGRRLHDFGKTLWWAVGVILLSLVPVMLLAAIVGGESFRDLILKQGVDDSGHRSLAYLAAIGGAFLIQHAFTVWLGLRKGDEGPNRFGAPKTNWGSARQEPTSAEPTIWEARLWEDDDPRAPAITPALKIVPPPVMTPASPKAPMGGSPHAPGAVRPAFGRRLGP